MQALCRFRLDCLISLGGIDPRRGATCGVLDDFAIVLDNAHYRGLFVDVLRFVKREFDHLLELGKPAGPRGVLLGLCKFQLGDSHALYVHRLFWIVHRCEGLDVGIKVTIVG